MKPMRYLIRGGRSWALDMALLAAAALFLFACGIGLWTDRVRRELMYSGDAYVAGIVY